MENEELDEFFTWIEAQTFQMRKQQGRVSTLSEPERQSAFQKLVMVLRVPLEMVESTFHVLRKRHRDPTLPELLQHIQEEEAKRLEAVMQGEKHRLIKLVHKDTLVRKSDIEKVYDSMLDVNTRLPTRETLAMKVRTTYYNQYPHLRVKPLV
jgi:hypothetical protein